MKKSRVTTAVVLAALVGAPVTAVAIGSGIAGDPAPAFAAEQLAEAVPSATTAQSADGSAADEAEARSGGGSAHGAGASNGNGNAYGQGGGNGQGNGNGLGNGNGNANANGLIDSTAGDEPGENLGEGDGSGAAETDAEGDVDTIAPTIQDAVFAPLRGVHTFTLSQAEEHPARTYVEIQQKDDAGIWRKASGEWFLETNEFAFTVDTDALADGPDTQLKVSTWDAAGNHASKTFAVVIDRIKPVATLVAPAASGPVNGAVVDIQVDATDDHGLSRITANVYRDGVLYTSTSSTAGGALAATHTAAVTLPDGEYVIRYNASDLAGNIASTGHFALEVDTTAPVITVKDGASIVNGIYNAAPSFKLMDPGLGQIDYVVANGVTHDRTNAKWSDLNAGNYTAAQGRNTIELVDTAGNSTVFEFTLDTVAPVITVKDGAAVVNGVYTAAPSFKLMDSGIGQIDYIVANGRTYDRTNAKWSDLNAGNYTAVQGLNTIEVFDTAGNSTVFEFTLDSVAPEVTSIAQEYQDKEGGRTSVTLTFSEPIDGATLGQGWYGEGTVFTKAYYRAKEVTVTFADLVGNTGTATFDVQEPVAP